MHLRQCFHNATANLCLLTLCIATVLCQSPDNEITDHTESGIYLIVYCNANILNSHAAYLEKLIPYMQSNLQAVLSDLDLGTASPAYRAFFKTNDSLDAVRHVFTDIINGSALLSVGPQNVTEWSPPINRFSTI